MSAGTFRMRREAALAAKEAQAEEVIAEEPEKAPEPTSKASATVKPKPKPAASPEPAPAA